MLSPANRRKAHDGLQCCDANCFLLHGISGVRAGKQSFVISLLWPAMFGLLLAVKLRQYDKEVSARQA